MSIVLGLLAAFSFGVGDLLAGIASRSLRAQIVAAGLYFAALSTVLIAVLFFPGEGPTAKALTWGAIAGLGSASGALCLYHGMTVGRISTVITLAGLFSAVVPVFVGVAEGNSLSVLSAIGIAIAIPAIGLVSWHPTTSEGPRSGAVWGVLAGLGFAFQFIFLHHAGTDSGAWPITATELVAFAITLPLAITALTRADIDFTRLSILQTAGAGVLIGLALCALLAAFEVGELSIVVVLTSLYPAVTVVLARIFLSERWIGTQKLGLVMAFVAVLLVSAGTT